MPAAVVAFAVTGTDACALFSLGLGRFSLPRSEVWEVSEGGHTTSAEGASGYGDAMRSASDTAAFRARAGLRWTRRNGVVSGVSDLLHEGLS